MVAVVDELGTLIGFLLLPEQIHHSKGVSPLSNKAPFGVPLADKAFDNNGLPTVLDARGATVGIPQDSPQRPEGPTQASLKWRHLMENFLARIKKYRVSAPPVLAKLTT